MRNLTHTFKHSSKFTTSGAVTLHNFLSSLYFFPLFTSLFLFQPASFNVQLFCVQFKWKTTFAAELGSEIAGNTTLLWMMVSPL